MKVVFSEYTVEDALPAERVRLSLRFLIIALLFCAALCCGSAHAAERDTAWRVAEIYLATMGYAPDAEGLDYWTSNIETLEQWTPTTVAQSFFDQPLVQAQYPESLGNGPLIEALYWNIFDRAPDADGYDYWMGQLEPGVVQRNQMIIALINGGWANSEAATDMERFGNRVQVALAFADYQREHGIFYSLLTEEQQAALRQAGRDALAGVGSSAQDLEAGLGRIPGLLASLLGQTPSEINVTLVGASSLTPDSIQLDWLATDAGDGQGSAIRFLLHAGTAQGFVPDASTAYTEVLGTGSGVITGLMAESLYYVKVEAIDSHGESVLAACRVCLGRTRFGVLREAQVVEDQSRVAC